MSGQTPVASGSRPAADRSTATPLASRISREMRISPCGVRALGRALQGAVEEQRLEVREVPPALAAQGPLFVVERHGRALQVGIEC